MDLNIIALNNLLLLSNLKNDYINVKANGSAQYSPFGGLSVDKLLNSLLSMLPFEMCNFQIFLFLCE